MCSDSYKSSNSSLKILLEFGADPNVKDESDQTPIFLALSASHETTVQSLLQAGASLTVITKVSTIHGEDNYLL